MLAFQGGYSVEILEGDTIKYTLTGDEFMGSNDTT